MYDKIRDTDDVEQSTQIGRFRVRITDKMTRIEELVSVAGIGCKSIFSGGRKLDLNESFEKAKILNNQ